MGTQKWMVYFMENPISIEDLGVPLFQETPIGELGRGFVISNFALTSRCIEIRDAKYVE